MVEQARVVVIGGGIAGVSVALHLARSGWREIMVLEKGALTSGSTSQAAGLVTAFNPSATMMAFRRYSIELYRTLGTFQTVGSLRIASSPEQWRELRPLDRYSVAKLTARDRAGRRPIAHVGNAIRRRRSSRPAGARSTVEQPHRQG